MAKDHIVGVALAQNHLAHLAANCVPNEEAMSEVNEHLVNSDESLYKAMHAANAGSIESSMHLHDSVRHLGKVARLIVKHSSSPDEMLTAAQIMDTAKLYAAQHEQDGLDGAAG